MHKRTALFKGLVVVDEFEEGGGGGGADLPVGLLGDVLYHDGADWVAKQVSTLGFATTSWVASQNYVNTYDARLSNARPASDVYAWAKAYSKPNYNFTEISSATVEMVDVGFVNRKVIIANNKAGNGYISRASLALTNGANGFSPVILGVGMNDAGTSWTDFSFNPDGHLQSPKGTFWNSGNAGTSAHDWSAKKVVLGDLGLFNNADRLAVTTENEMYARGISVDSLLCSYSYSDYIHVPENGIFIRGRARMWMGVDVEDVNAVSNFSGTTNINGTLFCKGLVVVNSY